MERINLKQVQGLFILKNEVGMFSDETGGPEGSGGQGQGDPEGVIPRITPLYRVEI